VYNKTPRMRAHANQYRCASCGGRRVPHGRTVEWTSNVREERGLPRVKIYDTPCKKCLTCGYTSDTGDTYAGSELDNVDLIPSHLLEIDWDEYWGLVLTKGDPTR
jgi:ribosomal protein L37E